MGKFLNLIASPFHDSARINRKVIVSYLNRSKTGGVFLEVGPGDAPLLEAIKIAPDQKVFLDLPGSFPKCRRPESLYIEQDAGVERWALEDESIDVLVSSQCLEHIPNTDHFISEANRVLKKGGVLILSVPNQGALVFCLMMLITINPTMNEVSNKFIGLGNPLSSHRFQRRENYCGYTHLRLFTTRAMNDLLKIYGFKVNSNHGATWGIPWVGEFLAGIFPYYGLFTIVMATKIQLIES